MKVHKVSVTIETWCGHQDPSDAVKILGEGIVNILNGKEPLEMGLDVKLVKSEIVETREYFGGAL